jgi:heme/copper-type cytochrome/quinol oxidase subunit 2
MNKWYRLGLLCALLPLLTGTGIFVAWINTRENWLMGAGIYTITGGLILFVVGMVSIFLMVRIARKQSSPYKKKTALLACLLLINFPIAMGMTHYYLNILSEYKVLIVNNSNESADIFFLILQVKIML